MERVGWGGERKRRGRRGRSKNPFPLSTTSHLSGCEFLPRPTLLPISSPFYKERREVGLLAARRGAALFAVCIKVLCSSFFSSLVEMLAGLAGRRVGAGRSGAGRSAVGRDSN